MATAARLAYALACVGFVALASNEGSVIDASPDNHNEATPKALRSAPMKIGINQHMEGVEQKLLASAGGSLTSSSSSATAQLMRSQQEVNNILTRGVSAATPDSVAKMETAVLELVTDGKSKPMDTSVKNIKDLINDVMLPKVAAAHKLNQDSLDKTLAALSKGCTSLVKASQSAGDVQKKVYLASSASHKACRSMQAALATRSASCGSHISAKLKVWQDKERRYIQYKKYMGSTWRNVKIARRRWRETSVSYVDRLHSTYCGTNGHNSVWSRYHSARDAKLGAKKAYDKAIVDCKTAANDLVLKKKECTRVQFQMDSAACQRAVLVKDGCENYASCYTTKLSAYKIANTTIRKEEADRKSEYKALKRMQCLIDSFGDGKVEASEVTGCKDKVHATDSLNILYQPVPNMEMCSVPDRYPATAAYKKAEFATLPALARGNPEANECYGVLEISTRPKAGSPVGCKCIRMTMNGPYSAGALVKCENCLDISKSQDKNSCPDGTKVFSPRTRQDWKTISVSVAPLRAPNFIVDITRPQNGCGGCTKAQMNSAITAQRTWVTADGSPWWLRSSNYNEPNGDYTANCYLDLLKPPKEDDVSFNDQKCTYHSKSYYCQRKRLSTTPKHGSPPSCKCQNIQLTGAYTAGALLKCTACLAARRSMDKNSCPEGSKIFSPRSRQDWTTFIDSAAPLRAPYWIVDVTRPQNGCGGCTRSAMNSGIKAQFSWKTTDKSQWWLRNTMYNEPNGDYTANCYLDLWSSPKTADYVTFNDGRCNYYSRSYYCQPTLAAT